MKTRPRPRSRWRKRRPPRPQPAVAPPMPPARPVRFTGDAKAFWRLLLRGALLLAVTLGIYRFWLATDVRRFLWSHTEVAGEHLEYNGTATELLIGFLIAIAILVPINLAFFLAALGMGTAGEVRQHARLSAAVRARPVRGLSGAALSPHPHGAARRALPSDRLRDPLRVLRDVLVGADRAHPRPDLSVHASEPRALQDAEHILWRLARTLRGFGLPTVPARLPDVVPGHGAAGVRDHRRSGCAQLDRSSGGHREQQRYRRFRPRRELGRFARYRRRCRLGECRACLAAVSSLPGDGAALVARTASGSAN